MSVLCTKGSLRWREEASGTVWKNCSTRGAEGAGEAQKGQEPSPAASHAAFSLFWMEVQGAFGKRQERRGAPRGSRVPMPGVLGGGLLVTN